MKRNIAIALAGAVVGLAMSGAALAQAGDDGTSATRLLGTHVSASAANVPAISSPAPVTEVGWRRRAYYRGYGPYYGYGPYRPYRAYYRPYGAYYAPGYFYGGGPYYGAYYY